MKTMHGVNNATIGAKTTIAALNHQYPHPNIAKPFIFCTIIYTVIRFDVHNLLGKNYPIKWLKMFFKSKITRNMLKHSISLCKFFCLFQHKNLFLFYFTQLIFKNTHIRLYILHSILFKNHFH